LKRGVCAACSRRAPRGSETRDRWRRGEIRHIFNDNLGDPSVPKGVLILAVLSVVAVVIGARQFGRAVA